MIIFPVMCARRLILIILSPIWLPLSIISLVVGISTFSGTNPAEGLAITINTETADGAKLAVLAVKALLLPFHFIFIAWVAAAALWVFRRRRRIAGWLLGEPLAERIASADLMPGEMPAVFQPNRHLTLLQIFSSSIGIAVILVAMLLAMGQFINRADLALVIAALTSSLAWGARLPISDLLGGISNILEGNLAVGDNIRYRQFENIIDGTVETVDVRFLSVRALTGELTSIPFGELRIFRNYSRGQYIGIYAIFPIAALDLSRAYQLLTELAPQSTELVPHLVEPWQPMSVEGVMGANLDLYLFGKTTRDLEDELQLALHTLVRDRFAAAGIPFVGKGSPST